MNWEELLAQNMTARLELIVMPADGQGLAEQLLNVVVKHERADLEEQRESLIQQMSSNKVLLSNLEESLLSNLSNASGNILDNQVTQRHLTCSNMSANWNIMIWCPDSAVCTSTRSVSSSPA